MSCNDHLMKSLKKYIAKKEQTSLMLCGIQESEKVWINTMKAINVSIIEINNEELELSQIGIQQVLQPLLDESILPGDLRPSKFQQLKDIFDKYKVMEEKWNRFESKLKLFCETVTKKETSWKTPVPKYEDFGEMTAIEREKLAGLWKDGEWVILELASIICRLKWQWANLEHQLREGIQDCAKRVSVVTGKPIPTVKHTNL